MINAAVAIAFVATLTSLAATLRVYWKIRQGPGYWATVKVRGSQEICVYFGVRMSEGQITSAKEVVMVALEQSYSDIFQRWEEPPGPGTAAPLAPA